MKCTLFTCLISFLATSAHAGLCSSRYNTQDRYFEWYVTSTLRTGKTVELSLENDTLVAKNDGSTWDLTGARARSQRLVLKDFLGTRDTTLASLATGLTQLDDKELYYEFFYEDSNRSADYIGIHAYAGGNPIGAYYRLSDMQQVAEISDGDLINCTSFAHEGEYIEAQFTAQKKETYDGNTTASFEQWNKKTNLKVCYKGTQTGATIALHKMAENSGILTPSGILRRSLNHEGEELETDMEITKSPGKLIFKLLYQFPEGYIYDLQLEIRRCN